MLGATPIMLAATPTMLDSTPTMLGATPTMIGTTLQGMHGELMQHTQPSRPQAQLGPLGYAAPETE